ncbi:hypothetical protein E2C01_098515 [Portunus trituberculatus]|uniref:Uncharacterized protein n=1 Tax=Portunus trituberculatus TaxID=210409 RepID=A0A5B7K7V2_PORTR|nr:hypothetical protein [Portunus trituberculatus]
MSPILSLTHHLASLPCFQSPAGLTHEQRTAPL